MKKSGFLTFCFSLIPGAGQMYQEYMKRGLSIMIIFFIFVCLASIVSTPIFLLPLPVIYAYSFFDTYNIRNRIGGDNVPKDEYIWKNFNKEDFGIDLSKAGINKVIGIVMIIAGIYVLLNNVLSSFANRFDIEWLYTMINFILRYAPPMLVAAIAIWFGVKLIKNGSNNKNI